MFEPELKEGPATIMLADKFPEYDILGPSNKRTGTGIHLHVKYVDEITAILRSTKGEVILVVPIDQHHGEQQCRLGSIWP